MRRYLIRAVGIVFLTCFGTVVGLALGEATIRTFKLWAFADYAQMTWYRKVLIPGVPYLLKPNLHAAWGIGNVATDDFGLRNNHPAEKPAGVYRVLLLGDSVTFGYGVDQKQSFPAVLEQLLGENGNHNYQIINAGVPGYSIMDEAALLPSLVDRYKPDLILWTAVSNDYDDSFGIDERGAISGSGADYVVNAGHIGNWGNDGRPYIDVDDFRRSMVPRVRAQTEGPQPPESLMTQWDNWLRSRSLAYSLIRNRSIPMPAFTSVTKPTEVEFMGKHKTADGRSLLMMFFSPSFSSRRAIERANQSIERVRAFSQSTRIPVVLINHGIPIAPRWMNSRDSLVYQDLGDYLGESASDFFFHNNLGWDSHPNPSGNRKIAQALQRLLACLGYVPKNGGCQGAEPNGDSKSYWEDFEQRRLMFNARYLGPIDLDRFRGIHQILGGIYPARMFPGPLARRANFLLPAKPATSVVVSSTMPGNDSMTVRFDIFAGDKTTTSEFAFKPGENQAMIDIRPLSEAIASSPEPIELQMKCVSEKCPPMQLHLITAQ